MIQYWTIKNVTHVLAYTFKTNSWQIQMCITSTTSDGVKDTSLKAKTKDFKIVLEDEDLSSRTPTLVNMN